MNRIKIIKSIKMINQVSDEVRVKNEPICDIPESKVQLKKVKEEPIDIEIQLKYNESKSKDVEIKAEEEFTNKTSIAFWNEKTNRTVIHEKNSKYIQHKEVYSA